VVDMDGQTGSMLRLALLHLAPRVADLAHNCQLIETAVTAAAGLGAEWILTPELCVCGYQFSDRIGTDWIQPPPDPWMRHLGRIVADLRVTVFLSHPERDPATDKLYNTVFVSRDDGTWTAAHRKINVLGGAEAWSSPGETALPIAVPPLSVGVLICADAYTPGIAQHLQAQGAQILVSSAAWPPRPHGPDGAWERRSRETGLPVFVCNRTGVDGRLDFVEAESVVVSGGERLLSFEAPDSTVIVVDWDVRDQTIIRRSTYPVASVD
jgi:predicted amidohydrolase